MLKMLERKFIFHPMLWLITAVFLRSINQLLMKYIALESVHGLFTWITLLLGLSFFGLLLLRALCWQKALNYYPLSTAYPFYGLTMLSLMVFGYCFFDENIRVGQLVGVTLVFVGICIVAMGKRRQNANE